MSDYTPDELRVMAAEFMAHRARGDYRAQVLIDRLCERYEITELECEVRIMKLALMPEHSGEPA